MHLSLVERFHDEFFPAQPATERLVATPGGDGYNTMREFGEVSGSTHDAALIYVYAERLYVF
jgi:hypothetical protein